MPKRSGLANPEISGVHHDSRTVRSGGIFVALPGFKTDGGRFVAEAVRRGAVAIVAEKMPSPKPGVPCVVVPDARFALSALSSAFLGSPSHGMIVVGITGTNGKTTTSYILERIFRDMGFKTGVIGTIGYKIGDKVIPAPNTTPESSVLQGLLRKMADAGVQAVLMEVSSHGLSLKRVEHVEFDAAVFTNLTRDHLDFHKTFAEYFSAKKRLFELLKRSPKSDKFCALNTDDTYGRKLANSLRGSKKFRVITFGITKDSDVRAESPSFGLGETAFLWNGLDVETHLSGRFNASNVLASLAVAEGFRFKTIPVLKSLRNFRPVDGRFEVLPRRKGHPAVIVDYAHTDDALRNVLSTLKDLKPRRIITVFGCGGDRDRTKRPLMGKAAAEYSDLIFVTSDNPRSEDPAAIIAEILKGIPAQMKRKVRIEPDRRKAIAAAIRSADARDAVLIAGKGHETYQIFRDRTVHFSDREEALKLPGRRAG